MKKDKSLGGAPQLYDLRDAEIMLGIAKYTGNHINKRHPLPKPAAVVGRTPVWTAGQLAEWYESRPKPGGDRRSKEFRKQLKRKYRGKRVEL